MQYLGKRKTTCYLLKHMWLTKGKEATTWLPLTIIQALPSPAKKKKKKKVHLYTKAIIVFPKKINTASNSEFNNVLSAVHF